MSSVSYLYLVTFLAFVAVIDGCESGSGRPKTPPKRKSREIKSPILVGESGLGLLLRPRNTKDIPKDAHVEEIFRKIDTNSDGMIDAAEWVDLSKNSSVWDFVDLHSYTDTNDDDAVSLEEFLSVQFVKVDQSDEKQGDLGVTSS